MKMDEKETEKRHNLSLNASSVPSNLSSNHTTHYLLTAQMLLMAWLKTTSPRQHSVSLFLNRCWLYLVHSRWWDGAIDIPASEIWEWDLFSAYCNERHNCMWLSTVIFKKRERETWTKEVFWFLSDSGPHQIRDPHWISLNNQVLRKGRLRSESHLPLSRCWFNTQLPYQHWKLHHRVSHCLSSECSHITTRLPS